MDQSKPLICDFKSAQDDAYPNKVVVPLINFDSYQFERSVLTPAAAFRFTAPGVDKNTRLAIRSGDWIELFVTDKDGNKIQLATGIVDETDTHVMPSKVEYVITGRDLIGQLIDNASVDAQNRVYQIKSQTIGTIIQILIANTRIPQTAILQDVPNGQILFQTSPSETKMGALQRCLELTNCLIWSSPNGQIKIGRPKMSVQSTPNNKLILDPVHPGQNNCLEGRSRRGPNLAIRQIVVQLQNLELVDAGAYTVNNQDADMKKIKTAIGGRSVFETFTYGEGGQAADLINFVGNQSGDPKTLGATKARRELAKDNMKILDVEVVVRGHVNGDGNIYDVDQIYNVQIPDDDVAEDMYVYSVTYDLTIDHGMTTRLKLCRLGTIVAQVPMTGAST